MNQTSARLGDLVASLAGDARVTGDPERTILGVTLDSRQAKRGWLFVAMKGERTDGHFHISQAVLNGACAVVMSEPHELPAAVVGIVVPDTARAASHIADAFYAHPSQALDVVGITGTNGKTTTVHMLAAMCAAGGVPCGTMGTLGAQFSAYERHLENTTPLAPQLHAVLADMRHAGAHAVAMEVSSHALALHRVTNVRFKVGALTNITRDHLDFHKTTEAYVSAKRALFEMAERCVFNADDALGAAWATQMAPGKQVVTYGSHHAADVRAERVESSTAGSAFVVDGTHFMTVLPGAFNVSNALCALACARTLGISDADAARGLLKLKRVAGRMEHAGGGGIDVVVDYSHTPDALENALKTLREGTRGRVIVVFGCGGDRDRGKRREMGAVAARLADLSYVTSDNPRSEDPAAIIADIEPGLGGAPYRGIVDRAEAIEAAVSGAQPGDVVLIAGKGHETYQIIGEEIRPFDDLAFARRALAKREIHA